MFWLMVKQFYFCPNSYKTYVSTRNCAFSKVPDSQNFEYIEELNWPTLTQLHFIRQTNFTKALQTPNMISE